LPTNRVRSRAAALFNLAALIAGTGLAAWMVLDFGPARLLSQLTSVRGWFAALFVGHVVSMTLSTFSTRYLLRPHDTRLSFARLWIAQAAGEALNFLLPSGKVGEAQKVTLLADRVPRAHLVAAVLSSNILNWYISVGIMVVGVPVAVRGFAMPPATQHFLLLSAGAALLLAAALFVLVRRGLLGTLLRGLPVGAERRRRWRAALAVVDRDMRGQGDPGQNLLAAAGLALAARIAHWTELYLILLALGYQPGLGFMVAISAATVILTSVAAVVLLGLGLLDGGTYGLFALLGAPPELGVSAVMVRRARMLMTAGLELGLAGALLARDRAGGGEA
jgi:uncharacterized membrane protein YbhN (UPF0104 family)